MAAEPSDQSASEQPNVPAPPPEGGAADSKAQKEADFVQNKSEPSEDWDEWARTSRIRRDELLRRIFFYAVAGLMILAAILLAITAAVWVLHLIGPNCWRWLQPNEVEKLQVILFSGGVSSLATLIGRRILKERNDGNL